VIHRRPGFWLSFAAASFIVCSATEARQQDAASAATLVEPLTATVHPPLPRDPIHLWLVPTDTSRHGSATTKLGAGARLFTEARYAQALTVLPSRAGDTQLAHYTQYYRGLAELRLSHFDQARRIFEDLQTQPLVGYLTEAVRLREAEVAEAQGDMNRAASLYTELAAQKPLAPEAVLTRLAHAQQASGDRDGAAKTWARLYYEFPLSDESEIARAALDEAHAWQPFDASAVRFKLELGRAERLFAARRYAQARSAFEPLAAYAGGDDAEIVALRLAESDCYLRRYAAARDALEPWIRKASRRAEAQFFYLTATREQGATGEYVRLARELVAAFPNDSWAEETLNNLATHYILQDDDTAANGVFREILEEYPQSRHAQRAAWKAGWYAYRHGDAAEAVRLFDQAAAHFPRSDYRPSWLYWSARAHDRLGHADTAVARLSLVIADYENSYYGRLAAQLLDERGAQPVTLTRVAAVSPADVPPEDAAPPPNHEIIRQLIAQELYEDAMNELLYAQRTWGDSPAIEATLGLVYARTGELRRGINAMKRAYPQYIAAGGDELPAEMQKVLFPVAYWDQIRRYASLHGLDPYILAALMAQESTFDPEIKSSANAVGLMQVLPGTGRQYARKVGIRRFRASMLTNATTNIRLGTAIFRDLVDRFGGVYLALASYNAGEAAVAKWVAERPGLAREEFIDDIPYPETQNYVRKILGTAEDYRRLYGTLHTTPNRPALSRAVNTAVADSTVPAMKKTSPSKPRAHRKPVRRTRRDR
jgi:soluble lytic murein transglycosylase